MRSSLRIRRGMVVAFVLNLALSFALALTASAQDATPPLAPNHSGPPLAPPGWLGLVTDDRDPNAPGLVVIQVDPRGPAQLAGIRTGDRIQKVNERAISSTADMQQALSKTTVGSEVVIEVGRGTETQTFTVKLGHRPAGPRPGPPTPRLDDQPAQQPPSQQPPSDLLAPNDALPLGPHPRFRPLLGARVLPLTIESRQSAAVPVEYGALITQITPGTPADRAGLRERAVIVAIDDVPVRGPADLADYLTTAKPGQTVTLTLYYGNIQREVSVTLAEVEVPGDEAPPYAPGTPYMPGAPDNFTGNQPNMGNQINPLQQIMERLEALERRLAELEAKLAPAAGR